MAIVPYGCIWQSFIIIMCPIILVHCSIYWIELSVPETSKYIE